MVVIKMTKLSREQLVNNVDLVKVFRANKQDDDVYEALKKANFVTRASKPNNDEVTPSKDPYFIKHPEWSVLPYKLPDANIVIDVFVSNKSYRNIFPDDDNTDSMYYSRVVNFEEMSNWNDMFNTSNVTMYVRINGLKKDNGTMIIDVRSFIEIYNLVYPRHFYDMYEKNIGRTIDWKGMGVELYGGVLQIQKNKNVLYLNVWTVNRDIDVDNWPYADQILKQFVEELELRDVHGARVMAMLNPSKDHVNALKNISEISMQMVDTSTDKDDSSTGETDLQDEAIAVKKKTFKSELTRLFLYESLLIVIGYFRLKMHQTSDGVMSTGSALIITIISAAVGIIVCLLISKFKAKKAYNLYINTHS